MEYSCCYIPVEKDAVLINGGRELFQENIRQFFIQMSVVYHYPYLFYSTMGLRRFWYQIDTSFLTKTQILHAPPSRPASLHQKKHATFVSPRDEYHAFICFIFSVAAANIHITLEYYTQYVRTLTNNNGRRTQ
jgi:hypothetical protein